MPLLPHLTPPLGRPTRGGRTPHQAGGRAGRDEAWWGGVGFKGRGVEGDEVVAAAQWWGQRKIGK